jgi:signal peptidase II
VCFGRVVDFLDFYIGQWHWPAFNVADSAISLGVMILVVGELCGTRTVDRDPSAASPGDGRVSKPGSD